MRRRHLFEFTDQSWYPQTFRSIQTDYLEFITTRGAGHKNLVPLFARALAHANEMQIIDLCSGGGGPWIRLVDQLRDAGLSVNVTLTDKYPNRAVRYQWEGERTGITYLQVPVDASRVPGYLKGMRTLFEGFHHFRPDQAQMILRDAFENRVPVGIFEASLTPPQGPLIFLLSPLMTLLGYFFVTPFIHPRTLSRFFWTYLLPIVPLATCWDGWVSFLRIYSRQELTELIAPLKSDDYVWEIGKASTGTILFSFVYLLGYPQ